MQSINFTQHSLSLAAALDRIQTKSDASNSRVSSGNRLDRPATDVAGMSQANKLDSQQARLSGVEVNLQNGISRLQVTGGQLNTIAKVATRMAELSALSNNAIQDPASQSLYQVEFSKLQEQLRSTIGGTTAQIGGTSNVSNPSGTFNGSRLFGPGPGETLAIGVQSNEQLTLPVLDLSTGALGSLITQDASGAFTTTLATAGSATTISSALDQASSSMSQAGAVQSRLDFSASIASTLKANHEAALSAIRDTDMAAEVTQISRLQVLNSSTSSMITQSKEASAKLLALLSGN